MTTTGSPVLPEEFRRVFRRIQSEIGKVIVGYHDVVQQILTAFFAGGHVLIEGVPGTGKTLMVRTLAAALNLSFRRVQFTVDLMPADITGTQIFSDNAGERHFEFRRGPLFTQVLLADEINRATPKTQSALLEAMAELQVTADGTTHHLPTPFFVLATLNPIEMEGTYPLPEAQIDRFLFRVQLPYPDRNDLRTILSTTTGPKDQVVNPVFPAESAPSRLDACKRLVREVLVAPHLEEYAAALVSATIPPLSKFAPADAGSADKDVVRYIEFGSSPRGGQALLLGAKVTALLDGRVNVAREDIAKVAVPALAHRLVLNFTARADAVDPNSIIQGLLRSALPSPS